MRSLFIISLVFAGLSAHCQDIGLRFKSKNPNATKILTELDLAGNTCGTTAYDVGRYGQLLVFREVDANRYGVLLEKNNDGGNYALIETNYCINKDLLHELFRPKGTVDHGVLSVPFKLRFGPVKIMAGGELGYYVGRRWRKTSLVFHAGLSPVSLNNATGDTPETKLGITTGVGLVYRVSEDFQIGIIEGHDFFEGVETWTYKYKPWLSLSVGYSFLKPNRKTVEAANAK